MVNKIPQSLLLDSVTTALRSISAPPIWLVMLTSHLHERRCQVITVIAHTCRQIRTYCVVRLSLVLLRLINVLHVFFIETCKAFGKLDEFIVVPANRDLTAHPCNSPIQGCNYESETFDLSRENKLHRSRPF